MFLLLLDVLCLECHRHIAEVSSIVSLIPMTIALFYLLNLIRDIEFQCLELATILLAIDIGKYYLQILGWEHIISYVNITLGIGEVTRVEVVTFSLYLDACDRIALFIYDTSLKRKVNCRTAILRNLIVHTVVARYCTKTEERK